MKHSETLIRTINRIVKENPRYSVDAYFFIQEAVAYTLALNSSSEDGHELKHVSCTQLVHGIKRFLLEQFGPLAIDVLKSWSINSTADFGKIVFTMIQYKILVGQKKDSPEDFIKAYDFYEEFIAKFLPLESKVCPQIIA